MRPITTLLHWPPVTANDVAVLLLILLVLIVLGSFGRYVGENNDWTRTHYSAGVLALVLLTFLLLALAGYIRPL